MTIRMRVVRYDGERMHLLAAEASRRVYSASAEVSPIEIAIGSLTVICKGQTIDDTEL